MKAAAGDLAHPPQAPEPPAHSYHPHTIGYGLLAITMLIWGSFTLLSRWGTTGGLSPWDIAGLRFTTAATVLVPWLLWRGQWRFLWDRRVLWLGVLGGTLYSVLAYLGFAHAPAAHAAIWLNGMLPFATALSCWLVLSEPFGRDIRISLGVIAVALMLMAALMARAGQFHVGLGDGFFVLASLCWGMYTAFLKKWSFPPWQAMCGVAIWSAVLYLPVYGLFLPKGLAQASLMQIGVQAVFQGVFVVIVAMLTYIGAIERLGAFKCGSVLALAPLLAALAAVPLLHEPLTPALVVGLLGVSVGALQPWRWGRPAVAA